MVKTFQGVITDADGGAPVQNVHVWPLATRTGGVITDETGIYHIAIDDGSADYTSPWAIDLDGYGGGVVSTGKGLDDLEFSIYKTDAPVIVKAKAILKNNALGFIITVVAIVLLIKLSNRFL